MVNAVRVAVVLDGEGIEYGTNWLVNYVTIYPCHYLTSGTLPILEPGNTCMRWCVHFHKRGFP